jgi:hypothetical protein
MFRDELAVPQMKLDLRSVLLPGYGQGEGSDSLSKLFQKLEAARHPTPSSLTPTSFNKQQSKVTES